MIYFTFFGVLFVSLVYGAEQSLPQVVNVGFRINEGNKSTLVAYLLEAGYYKKVNVSQNITDYVNLLRLSNVTYEQYNAILSASNLSTESFNAWDILSALQVKLGRITLEFFSRLNMPPENFQAALDDLNMTNLMLQASIHPDNDTLIFGTFTNANWTNFDRALGLLNVTAEDVFTFGRDVIVRNLTKLTLNEFFRLVRPYGTANILKAINKVMQINYGNYSVEPLRNILEYYTTYLNTYNRTLATATSPNNFITLPNYFATWINSNKTKECLDVYFYNSTTSKLIPVNLVSFRNSSNGFRYANVTAKATSFAPVARESEGALTNCSYITDSATSVNMVRSDKGNLYLEENAQVMFVRGAPLICQGRLHGIAARHSSRTIDFITFYEKSNTTTTTAPRATTKPPKHTNSSVNLSSPSFAVLAVLAYIYAQIC